MLFEVCSVFAFTRAHTLSLGLCGLTVEVDTMNEENGKEIRSNIRKMVASVVHYMSMDQIIPFRMRSTTPSPTHSLSFLFLRLPPFNTLRLCVCAGASELVGSFDERNWMRPLKSYTPPHIVRFSGLCLVDAPIVFQNHWRSAQTSNKFRDSHSS